MDGLMEKEVDYLTIDTTEYKYHLLVGDDVYYANSVWSLIMEILNHKINRWID